VIVVVFPVVRFDSGLLGFFKVVVRVVVGFMLWKLLWFLFLVVVRVVFGDVFNV